MLTFIHLLFYNNFYFPVVSCVLQLILSYTCTGPYPGGFRLRYTGLGAQTLEPIKISLV